MGRPGTFFTVHSKNFAFRAAASMCVAAMGAMASPAMAEPEASTKLVRCGAESCLRVSGYRDDAAAIVRINGHAVSVEGERRWQVQLPIAVVREWSGGYARTIEVSLHDPESQLGSSADIELPIGMLGGMTNLSSLVISIY